jgi:hypothetical protein
MVCDKVCALLPAAAAAAVIALGEQFDARRRASPDPAVEPFIKQSIAKAGVLDKVFGGKPPKLSPEVKLWALGVPAGQICLINLAIVPPPTALGCGQIEQQGLTGLLQR